MDDNEHGERFQRELIEKSETYWTSGNNIRFVKYGSETGTVPPPESQSLQGQLLVTKALLRRSMNMLEKLFTFTFSTENPFWVLVAYER